LTIGATVSFSRTITMIVLTIGITTAVKIVQQYNIIINNKNFNCDYVGGLHILLFNFLTSHYTAECVKQKQTT
jgi:hypothetical protein